MRLQPHQPREIPDNRVNLNVEVDLSACDRMPQRLVASFQDVERAGIQTSISEIVSYAGIHFEGASDTSDPQAPVRMAWNDLSAWEYRTWSEDNSRSRLFVSPPANDSVHNRGTELLATGVGLIAATRIYQSSLPVWHRTTGLAPFDYTAQSSLAGGKVAAEVRGRMDGHGWARAIEQSREKLTQASELNLVSAAAILYAPRQRPSRNETDVLIIDPALGGDGIDLFDMYRGVLQHYIPFFDRQAFEAASHAPIRAFVKRMRELVASSDTEFAEYLRSGDRLLRQLRPWLASFRYLDYEFRGTAWSGLTLPGNLIDEFDLELGIPRTGDYYWTLWSDVITSIQRGRLSDLVLMQVPFVHATIMDRVFVLLPDGIAIAWAARGRPLSSTMLDRLKR